MLKDLLFSKDLKIGYCRAWCRGTKEADAGPPEIDPATGQPKPRPKKKKKMGKRRFLRMAKGNHPKVRMATRNHPKVRMAIGNHPKVRMAIDNHPKAISENAIGNHPKAISENGYRQPS
ncbi:hypothetical protein DPMN_167846 [Dreissena polymorpha]|uniref:Uncharacterized protein n=1 Tax=Dreissena polymorpha TaxID=45954 RepID=A0A9D4F4J2_DREPO|nr:hypothetical protein DPMN_167846 [Dreissena polymorpha]